MGEIILRALINFGAWGGVSYVVFEELANDIIKKTIKLGEGTTEAIGWLVVIFWVIKGAVYGIEKYLEIRRGFTKFDLDIKQIMKQIEKTSEEINDLKENNHERN